MFTVMLARTLISLLVLALALGLGWIAYERYLVIDDAGEAEVPHQQAAIAPEVGPSPAPEAAAPSEGSPAPPAPPRDERVATPEVALAPAGEADRRVPAPEPAAVTSRAPPPEAAAEPAQAALADRETERAPEPPNGSPVAPPERLITAPEHVPEPGGSAESAETEAPPAGEGQPSAGVQEAIAGRPEAAPPAGPDPAPWRPFSLDSLHGVLSGIFGGEDESTAAAPAGSVSEESVPPRGEHALDEQVAGAEGAPDARTSREIDQAALDPAAPATDDAARVPGRGAPTDATAAAEPEQPPRESLSLDSIRRALSAMVGGNDGPGPGDLPEPAAGPPEPDAKEAQVARVEPAEPARPMPPRFDIVRVGPDGRAVIAGRAEPGTEVEVKADNTVIDRVAAGRRGHWAATPLEPLKPGDHELSLVAWRAGERLSDSEEVVVVVVPEPPPPQPAPVAASEPPPPQPTPVAEPGPGDALAVAMPRSSAGQGRILQAPGRISGDGELALMVVDYDEQGMTRLTGEAPPGSAVRIYVDNQPAGEVITRADGEWTTVLDARLQPGTYTLRLDQLDGQGRPVARLETPFTRVSQPPIEGDVQVDYVVVQPGNSLWRIARRLFGQGMTYVHIYEANQAQIRDPDLIYPGQVFEIPQGLSAAG